MKAIQSRLYALVAIGWLVGAGCSYHYNSPLGERVVNPYRFDTISAEAQNGDETFVIVALAGAGLRGAAFAYGVLKELGNTPFGDRSLLDEVDVMTSVSGASFATAYYGLYGRNRFFEEFPRSVLQRDMTLGITLQMMWPWTGIRLINGQGWGDVVAQYYQRIFGELRFRDMPRRRPFIVINASEVSRGERFAFTQDHLDRLCSDLNDVTISRAVAASAAVPSIGGAIRLNNYSRSGSCNRPTWVSLGLDEARINPRRYKRALGWVAYGNSNRIPYVYLMDGSLADPGSLGEPEWALTTDDSSWSVLSRVNARKIKRIVLITADSASAGQTLQTELSLFPWLSSRVVNAVWAAREGAGSEAAELIRQRFAAWTRERLNFDVGRLRMMQRCGQLAKTMCEGTRRHERTRLLQCAEQFVDPIDAAPPIPTVYMISVGLDALEDPDLQARVEDIPSRFDIRDTDSEFLIETGADMVRNSPDYLRLVQDLERDAADPRSSDTTPSRAP